jgi:hypothetical protein
LQVTVPVPPADAMAVNARIGYVPSVSMVPEDQEPSENVLAILMSVWLLTDTQYANKRSPDEIENEPVTAG